MGILHGVQVSVENLVESIDRCVDSRECFLECNEFLFELLGVASFRAVVACVVFEALVLCVYFVSGAVDDIQDVRKDGAVWLVVVQVCIWAHNL